MNMPKDKEKVLEALADINYVSQVLFKFTEKGRQAVTEVEDSTEYMKMINGLEFQMSQLLQYVEDL